MKNEVVVIIRLEYFYVKNNIIIVIFVKCRWLFAALFLIEWTSISQSMLLFWVKPGRNPSKMKGFFPTRTKGIHPIENEKALIFVFPVSFLTPFCWLNRKVAEEGPGRSLMTLCWRLQRTFCRRYFRDFFLIAFLNLDFYDSLFF